MENVRLRLEQKVVALRQRGGPQLHHHGPQPAHPLDGQKTRNLQALHLGLNGLAPLALGLDFGHAGQLGRPLLGLGLGLGLVVAPGEKRE